PAVVVIAAGTEQFGSAGAEPKLLGGQPCRTRQRGGSQEQRDQGKADCCPGEPLQRSRHPRRVCLRHPFRGHYVLPGKKTSPHPSRHILPTIPRKTTGRLMGTGTAERVF